MGSDTWLWFFAPKPVIFGNMPLSPKHRPGWIWIVIAYLTAGIVAVGVAQAAPAHWHPLWVILAADVAATVAIFIFSFLLNNSSVYDAYWSVAPICIAGYFISQKYASPDANLIRQLLAFSVVSIWGGRLTFNWWRQWTGLKHEDWRYVQLKEQTGKAYWLVSFAGIHMFPTVLVYLGCMSLFPALHEGTHGTNVLDLLGALVCGIAIWIEATADKQLYRFVNGKPAPGTILKAGLWRHSRHPNYLGEILFWWGLFFFALASGWQYWWCVVGPLSINLLFVFISIPMHEKRSLQRRPSYAEHMQQVPRLVPRLRQLWQQRRADAKASSK